MEQLLAQATIADLYRSVPRHRLPRPERARKDESLERAEQALAYRKQVVDARMRGVRL